MTTKLGHRLNLAKHKLFVKINHEETFTDQEYDQLEEKFLQHLNFSHNLLSELNRYVEAIRNLGDTSIALSDIVGNFYSACVPDNIPRAVTIFQNSQTKISQRATHSADAEFSAIVHEWNEYCGLLRSVKGKTTKRREALEQFDYYKKKVQKLKEKPEKDEKKLPQNEAKLEMVKQEFTDINSELKEVFQILCDDAPNAFNPQLHSLTSIISDQFQQMSFHAAEMKPVTQSPAEYGCSILNTPKFKALIATYGIDPDANVVKRSLPESSSVEGITFQPHPSVIPSPSPNPIVESSSSSKKPVSPSSVPPIVPTITIPGGTSASSQSVLTSGLFESGKKFRALFDFESQNDDELSFRAGDVVTIIEESEEEGWWFAKLNDKQGMVPHNYVEPIED